MKNMYLRHYITIHYLSSPFPRSEKFLSCHCLGKHDPDSCTRDLHLPHALSPRGPPPQSLCHPIPRPQQRVQHLFGQRRDQFCPQQPEDPLAKLYRKSAGRPVRERRHPEEVFDKFQADFYKQQ